MFEVGSLIDGRYEVLSVLGKGGFGVVYKAKQVSTGQIVALKLLLPDLAQEGNPESANQTARFQREIELIAQLKHPNIVPLIDSGTLDSGQPFMVLEFVTGEDLEHALKREGPIEPREAKRIMMQVLDALACAHGQGIIHRDLKPANIMLVTTGARRNAVVLDFGIGGIVEAARGANYQQLTAAGKIFGTPQYMAPEQLSRAANTPQIDIYAWGLLFLEAMTGRRVVDSDSIAEVVVAHTSPQPHVIPPLVDNPDLRRVIEVAIAKDPQKRFATAVDAIEALDEVHIERKSTNRSLHSAEAARRIASMSGSSGGVTSQDLHTLHPPEDPSIDTGPDTVPVDMAVPTDDASGGTGGIIIAIVVVLLLIAGGAAGLWWFMSQEQGDSNPESTETQGAAAADVSEGPSRDTSASSTPPTPTGATDTQAAPPPETAPDTAMAAPEAPDTTPAAVDTATAQAPDTTEPEAPLPPVQELHDPSLNTEAMAQARERACSEKDWTSCYLVALQHKDGLGIEKNVLRARIFNKKACRQGKIVEACALVGMKPPK